MYNPLDDLPSQFHVRTPGSPAPTHYSIVTANSTPSPRHHQQVMSPNPLETTHDTASTTTASAPVTLQAAAEQQQLGGQVTLQQMTHISIPAETLRAFGTSIGEDLSFAADIQAAVTELSSRIQYRTEVLAGAVGAIGGSVGELQAGCQVLTATLDQLRDTVVRQQAAVQSLVEGRESDRRDARTQIEASKHDLRRYLEERGTEEQQVKNKLDESLQREASLLAKVEALTGRVAELDESVKHTQVRMQEHKRRLDAQEREIYAPLKGEPGDQASLARAVQALAEKVDRELAVLTTQQREQGEGLHNSLEQLRAAVLPKVQTEIDRLDERVSAIEEGPDKLEEVQLGATTSKDSHRDTQSPQLQPMPAQNNREPLHFELTPNTDQAPSFGVQDASSAWWDQTGDEPEHWSTWGRGRTEVDPLNPWGLTAPPPGLGSRRRTSSGRSPSPGARPGNRKSAPEIPNGKWKCLTDLPRYHQEPGEPWELGLGFTTWKRQILAVCTTVAPEFATFVEDRFHLAHQRHESRMSGAPIAEAPRLEACFETYEARLVVSLMRILPAEVKDSAVEDAENKITSLSLLEELVHQVQPGGQEEVASLLRYMRNLDPVQSARDALECIRRWKLARLRAAALNLPSTAPSEAMRALCTLVKHIEKRSDSLRTRMSLIKLSPDIQRPTELGVQMILETLDKELRQLAADEQLKAN